jgi:CRISPR/Cas system endoribonuclease Cas6 (RAMP superfamily)
MTLIIIFKALKIDSRVSSNSDLYDEFLFWCYICFFILHIFKRGENKILKYFFVMSSPNNVSQLNLYVHCYRCEANTTYHAIFSYYLSKLRDI